ncbi:MAG: hypothetical protein ACLTMP_07270 [Eggerthella lenta]
MRMIDRALFALEGIRGALAALVALAVARALLVVGQAWSLASAIVHLWEGAPLPDQAPLIVLFFLCFVGGQLVRYAQDSYLTATPTHASTHCAASFCRRCSARVRASCKLRAPAASLRWC